MSTLVELTREFRAWMRRPRIYIPGSGAVLEAVRSLDRAVPAGDSEEPVFVLATSWRSGSTLLQRILVSNPQVLVWGEPLGRLAIVPRLAHALAGVSSDWPPPDCWIGEHVPPGSLATQWIANLFPPGRDLRAALRDLFDRWLAAPARERGFQRWGVKEVRFGAAEACLLSWLYPSARFLVLTRHPFDAFRSLRNRAEWTFHDRWPETRIDSAAAFARHWNRLATSWSPKPPGLRCLTVRYEDLVSGGVDFRALESWLGFEIREQKALGLRLGETVGTRELTWYERLIIRREAAAGMRLFDYAG